MKNKTIGFFEEKIMEMIKVRPLPNFEVRAINVETLNEEYFNRTGSNLPSHLLSILTDWLLNETLTDKCVDKVTNNERPILSNRQLKRRYVRENSSECMVLDFLQQKCVMKRASLSKTLKKEVD